ncbi:MAG: stage II sporulation protein R [Clostridia bacterium]|nr:stage II sporulation protein R [Clostridia bacterium]
MSKRFCVAIVVTLVLLLLLSYLPIHGEAEVYDTVLRLHVLANSDSEEDQALKLKVRDGVLAVTAPLLENAATRDQAEAIVRAHMTDIQSAAEAVVAENGSKQTVTVMLDLEDYPTRNYESCAFPAGEYLSLRVCLGAAEGQNWWCVLFPPLCLSAATAKDDAEDAFIQVGLSKEQYGIVTETQSRKYRVRFKILETVRGWFD